MADVAGHGTPAAVIMTVMRTLIHAELPSNRDKSAGEFLEHVNGVMSETYLRDSRFVTVWAAAGSGLSTTDSSRRICWSCTPTESLATGGGLTALG